MIAHPTDDHLEHYVLRRLPKPESEAVEDHLLVCDPCRIRSEDVADFAMAMREALKTEPAQVASRWLGWFIPNFRLVAAFAGLVLAIALFWTSGRSRVVPIATLRLTAMRGGDIAAVVPSRELDITLDDATGASKVEIVAADGSPVWTSVNAPKLVLKKSLSPGDYVLRAYLPSGQLLHEYTFRIQSKK